MPKHNAAAKTKKTSKKTPQKTIVVLDSHAIIHRAYHALPSFVNSRGEPTGALYGLLSMLLRIIEEFNPDSIVAAFDLPKPTFRHHAYDAYKAGRAKADDELIAQLQSARTLFEVFHIPVLDAEGFEADDVIGTLAKKIIDPSWRVIIASGDMDTLQLVEDDRIQVFTLKKGVTDTVLYNETAVEARYGFLPERLIDYKGLRGDPSDNIIGVPGIGEKTATTLIQTFGCIEDIYRALEKNDAKTQQRFKEMKITERVQQLLREHKDDALFSKTLATIRIDAPVAFTPHEHSYKRMLDEEKIMLFLRDMEFKSLIARVKKLFVVTDEAHEPQAVLEKNPSIVADVSPEVIQKAAIALWVLKSDFSMADAETVLAETESPNIPEALEKLSAQLQENGLYELYEKLELPLIPIINAMHTHGVHIDRTALETAGKLFEEKMQIIIKEVHRLAGREFNLGSPKQLSELLFDELKLVPKGKRKASGAFTTNAEALDSMRELHPIIPLILEYREVQKLKSTYVEPILDAIVKGCVHADFYQNGTTTGRFSSAHPNLQNLPMGGEYAKNIRSAFVAGEENVFVSADYSQIELRVLAMLSGDEKLVETFQTGKDIHAAVAASIFNVEEKAVTNNQRRAAKVVNFGILYGMGVTALQKNLGSTRDEASKFYDNYFHSFPRINAFLENTKHDALRLGYTTTMFGRRRYFPGIKSPLPHIRAFAERMATNAPIQGTAADLVKVAILLIQNDLQQQGLIDAAHLVLQIHDELVYEVKEEHTETVKAIIENAMRQAIVRSPVSVLPTDVPLEVSSATGGRLDQLK